MSKRALLIGCNYPGSQAELRGCVNDVFNMKSLLEDCYGFQDFTILIDTDESYDKPTGSNIKTHLRDLITSASPGDILFVHFSGHGTQVPSDDPSEADMKDEALVPSDMNLLLDDDLRDLVKGLASGVKLTFVTDCCHSGGMLDHHEVQIEGPKDAEAVPSFNTGNLLAMFGLRQLGQPPEGITNRSLPTDKLLEMLSDQSGGGVDIGNIRNVLQGLFGNDASSKVMKYLGAAQSLVKNGGGSGCLGSILAALKGIFSSGGGGGSTPGTTPASTPGTTPASTPLSHASTSIAVKPGHKPPTEEQLGDDVGVLITGCQSSETSADACPGGDSSRAYGALSHSLQQVIRSHHEQRPDVPLTNQDLVYAVRKVLSEGYFSQNPCLECSKKNAESPFITG